MDWLDEFPTMERQELRDMKKAIDLGFRDFSRAYGEALENFFEPLLFFLVWLALLIGSVIALKLPMIKMMDKLGQ
mgnify:CR=1 FL=1